MPESLKSFISGILGALIGILVFIILVMFPFTVSKHSVKSQKPFRLDSKTYICREQIVTYTNKENVNDSTTVR